jgi:hypothetical protein
VRKHKQRKAMRSLVTVSRIVVSAETPPSFFVASVSIFTLEFATVAEDFTAPMPTLFEEHLDHVTHVIVFELNRSHGSLRERGEQFVRRWRCRDWHLLRCRNS